MKRIVIVVPSFPKLSETFIVGKVHALLERGWDVHVVCSKSEPAQWRHFPELQCRRDLKRRVHVAWPHRPRWLAGILTPLALLRGFFAQPGVAWIYLWQGLRL